jgi:hypothetical protein
MVCRSGVNSYANQFIGANPPDLGAGTRQPYRRGEARSNEVDRVNASA